MELNFSSLQQKNQNICSLVQFIWFEEFCDIHMIFGDYVLYLHHCIQQLLHVHKVFKSDKTEYLSHKSLFK